jgi:ADP-heptose:LPS heptosyltransferase
MEMTGRVMVMFPGSLGDFLCFLPAFQVVGRSSAQGVSFVGRAWLFELVRQLPYVIETISIDSGSLAGLFVADGGGDSLAFFSGVSQVFSWFGRARPEVRANLARVVPGQVRIFDFFVGQEDCHAGAYYLRCVGVPEIRCPTVVVGQREKQWVDHYWKACGWHPSARVLILHPGSGGRKKRWAAEGFASVARWWGNQRNCHVLIVLGPAEEQEEGQWRRVGKVETNLSLLQVAALLGRADLYLGNDSGMSHLAGAVGARGAVLFGPTPPQAWRPLGGSLSVLRNVAYRDRTPDAVGISLAEISAEEVITALQAGIC